MDSTSTNAHYGAESSGLICGFQFRQDGIALAIDTKAALAAINEIQNGRATDFLWLHFNLAHNATVNWLQTNLRLSSVFYETLAIGSQSTRVELDDDALIAVINDVKYDFNFESSDISTLKLSVGPNLLVSARLQPLQSIDHLRDAVKNNKALIGSTVELLVHLMHDQGDVLVDIVRKATSRVDEIEDKLHAGKLESKRVSLGALRRLLVRLQRLLAPEPAAMFRLLKTPPTWMHGEDVEALRQSTEEFNVTLSDLVALQERIKLLQEEIAGRLAESNNRSLFILTLVTVLSLPFTIISGLFGMNVGGIPYKDHDFGFWIVISIIVAIVLAAAWFGSRKSDH